MSIDVNTLKQIIAQVVQEMAAEDSAATPPAAEPAALMTMDPRSAAPTRRRSWWRFPRRSAP